MLTDFNRKVYERHVQRLNDQYFNNDNSKHFVLNFKKNVENQLNKLKNKTHDDKNILCENVAKDLQLELADDLFGNDKAGTNPQKSVFSQASDLFSSNPINVVPTQMSLFNNSPLMDLSSQDSHESSIDDKESDFVRLEKMRDDVRKICCEKSSKSINIDKEMKVWKKTRSARIFVIPQNNSDTISTSTTCIDSVGCSSELSGGAKGFIIHSVNDTKNINSSVELFVKKADIWFLVYILSNNSNIRELVTFSLKQLATLIMQSFGFSRSSDEGLKAICSVTSILLSLDCVDLQVCHAYLNRFSPAGSINNAQIDNDDMCDGKTDEKGWGELMKIYNVKPDDRSSMQKLSEKMVHEFLPATMLSELKHISSPASIVIGAQLEYVGLRVDMGKWRELCLQLRHELRKLEEHCNTNTNNNYKFSLTSPLALRQILYDKLKLHEKLSTTEIREAGLDHLLKAKSTAEPVLVALLKYDELPRLVLQHRKLSKLKSIYCDSLEGFLQSDDSNTHSRFVIGHWDQLSCVTGRIYCSKPNLQALPRDNDGDADYHSNISIPTKSIFVASLPSISLATLPTQSESTQCVFLSADFCQIELRLFAHMSNDIQLIQLFKEADSSESDLFSLIAQQIWPECVDSRSSSEYRQQVKRLVYAIMYGSGTANLASSLSMSPWQLNRAMHRIRGIMPELGQYTQLCKQKLEEQDGCLSTITGRRRRFHRLSSSVADKKLGAEIARQMTNYTIQGSAADICKYAMVQCTLKMGLHGLSAVLVLSRHDELVWQVPLFQMVEVVELVNKYMTISEINLAGFHCNLSMNIEPDVNLINMSYTNISKTDVNDKFEVIKLAVPLKVRLKRGICLDKMEEIQLD